MNADVVSTGANVAHPFLIGDPSILNGVVVHRCNKEFCGYLPLPRFLARKYEIACIICTIMYGSYGRTCKSMQASISIAMKRKLGSEAASIADLCFWKVGNKNVSR
jgi:hypothetical protein